jgi:hypothetical protein
MELSLAPSLTQISNMLGAVHSPARNMPPTILYNEGWLLRLVLDWYARHPDAGGLLTLHKGSRWYSEALLPSPFLRGSLREGYTHADAVIGHFDLVSTRGDIALSAGATQFVVVEAKMGSPLSAGTKHAPEFNQAARNVACMAKLIEPLGSTPSDARFIVLAPDSKLSQHRTDSLVTAEKLCEVARARAVARGEADVAWVDQHFVPMVESRLLRCNALAWEVVVEEIQTLSPTNGRQLAAFYQECLRYIRTRAYAT